MKTIVITLAAIILSGCGTAYRAEAEKFMRTQPPETWGAPPSATIRSAEAKIILARLKDPGSAIIESRPLERATIAASMTDPTVVPVWTSPVLVNAKNSFGGYTGAKLYEFHYSRGRLYAIDYPERGRVYLAALSP